MVTDRRQWRTSDGDDRLAMTEECCHEGMKRTLTAARKKEHENILYQTFPDTFPFEYALVSFLLALEAAHAAAQRVQKLCPLRLAKKSAGKKSMKHLESHPVMDGAMVWREKQMNHQARGLIFYVFITVEFYLICSQARRPFKSTRLLVCLCCQCSLRCFAALHLHRQGQGPVYISPGGGGGGASSQMLFIGPHPNNLF